MFLCPNCNQRLAHASSEAGRFWRCAGCGGRAVRRSTFRDAGVPAEVVDRLWESARRGEGARTRSCPVCGRLMTALPVSETAEAIRLDICPRCAVFWFDPKEFEEFSVAGPPGTPPSAAREPPGFKAGYRAPPKLARPAPARPRAKVEDEDELDWWKKALVLFGLPVEQDSPACQRLPLVTWILVGVVTLASLGAFFEFSEAVQLFGFVPAQAFRFGGGTLITSFFLHGGLLHLAGNMYFLLTFGDNVEDFLGAARYLLLILLATVVGDLFQLLLDPDSVMPCVGASGGISGVLVFYGLQFREARIAMFLRFVFVRLRAIWALLLWLAVQVIGVVAQGAGATHVAYGAHLGGAAVGLAGWLVLRKV